MAVQPTTTSDYLGSDFYLYPNSKSYESFHRQGRLAKAFIFSVKPAAAGPNLNGSAGVGGYTYAKWFQFNPPELNYDIQFLDANPPGADAPSTGPVNSATPYGAIGSAETSFEMIFYREQEVYMSTLLLRGTGPGIPESIPEPSNIPSWTGVSGRPWHSHGAMLDVLDVLRVITQDDEVAAEMVSGSSGQRGSMEALSRRIYNLQFDIVGQGQKALASLPFGVYFSPRFVLYGRCMGISFRFPKFNNRLVPTMAKVNINFQTYRHGAPAAEGSGIPNIPVGLVPRTGQTWIGAPPPNIPSPTITRPATGGGSAGIPVRVR